MREIVYGYDSPPIEDCFARSAPEQIGFELLQACNLRCEYCYLGDPQNRVKGAIELEQGKQVLAHLHEAGVISMQFFGGEPTLHPHLLEFVDYAKQVGIPDVGVQTNGFCKDEALVTELSNRTDWVHVTFRGSDGDTFDRHAGTSGSYEKAVRTLEILNRGTTFIGLEYDCCSDNWHQVEGLLDHLIGERKIDIREIWLHRIAPRGCAADMTLHSDVELFTGVLEQCVRIEEKFGILAKMEDSLPPCLFEDSLHPYILPCKGGFVSAYVDPTGNVRRCACSKHNIGNLFNESLESMWRESPVMKSFRKMKWLPEPCKNCAILNRCRGGCSVSSPCSDDHSPDVFSSLFKPRTVDGRGA